MPVTRTSNDELRPVLYVGAGQPGEGLGPATGIMRYTGRPGPLHRPGGASGQIILVVLGPFSDSSGNPRGYRRVQKPKKLATPVQCSDPLILE
jgi:hypothetical protein